MQLKMWFKGQKKLVNIDDSLAVSSWGKPVSGQKSKNGAWWSAMIEKAMAKFNVNYLNLQAGTSAYAYRELTGMPSTIMSTGRGYSAEKLWSDIERWDKKKYIMAGSCYSYKYGLTSGHAYTILGAYHLNGEKVLKMRNPWASEKYHGPWSDKDQRWTPALR